MTTWQQTIIIIYSLLGLVGSYRSYHECRKKRNSYGLTPQYYVYGAFVHGDMVIFGIFWFLVGMGTLFLEDWLLENRLKKFQ